jgi:hypothetical protein
MNSLLFASTIGVAFGWTLERAGLGSARKLVGQFYLNDLTVFKVMFSAIVTAMLGVFWLCARDIRRSATGRWPRVRHRLRRRRSLPRDVLCRGGDGPR